MAAELEAIVQRMIDAGESEENIATVIKGFPQPQAAPQVRSRTGALYTPPTESVAGDMAQGFGEAINPMGFLRTIAGAVTDPVGTAKNVATMPITVASDLVNHPAHALGNAAGMLATGGFLRGAAALPYGRIAKAGAAGAVAGAEKLPIVGPVGKAALKGAAESWRDTAPAVAESAPAAAPVASAVPSAAPVVGEAPVGPLPKPKLSAAEVAQRLRQEYGSDKAGQMLYGNRRAAPGTIPPAERTAAIKRLAPGESQLPGQAKRAIAGEYGKFQEYLASAPNERARQYILSLMKGASEP